MSTRRWNSGWDRGRGLPIRRLLGLVGAIGLTLALAGCAGAGTDSGSDADVAGLDAPAAAEPARDALTGATTADEAVDGQSAGEGSGGTAYQQPSVISTGAVALRGQDVGRVRFDVQKIADRYAGQITDERTETDREGRVIRSRLVLRVPAADFGTAMTALERTAELDSSTRTQEDVTTQVIDIDSRVRAQEASVRRIRLLLDRARTIRAIMSIEAQLTQRQADLDSLKQQQAWLADQTSLSTITVTLEQKDAAAATTARTGFRAGLARGWHSLQAFGTDVATLTGRLLPATLLLLLLGAPLVWLLRRHLPRRTASAAAD